ncbi:MAG: PPOX class F420-dependent oxidoreductase [Actinomycetes bacterium]
MTPVEALAFLAENPRAVLATHRADGMPQMSPVLATSDAEGRVLVSSRETAVKVKNLRRDPRVSMVVLNEGFFGGWAQVEGTAEIVSLPAAMPVLIDYYRRLSGEHPDWDEYRADMATQRRVVIRFAVTRAGPTVSG